MKFTFEVESNANTAWTEWEILDALRQYAGDKCNEKLIVKLIKKKEFSHEF